MNKKAIIIPICVTLTTITAVCVCLYAFRAQIHESVYKDYVAPTPVIESKWHDDNKEETVGDYYVSVNGNDSNVGDQNHPFKTIEKAKEVVRTIDKTNHQDITICIEQGEYRVNNLCFNYEDSGNENCQIIYKGIGNVIFNSGISLSPISFKSVSEYPNIASRLNETVKEHVKVLDLSKQGISKEEVGKMYAYGSYNTSSQYEGDTVGPIYSELFINKKRMEIARFPNTDYIYTDKVIFSSRDKGVILPNGDPKGDVYKINDELAKRISGWKNIDDVWMYGFFMYDWADQATSLLSFDKNTSELETKYYSFFGAKEGAPYYFYNCLEELDVPGEYYIDRDNNLLIVYETEDFPNCKIEMSLATNPIIRFNANYVTLDNIKMTGTRDMGIYANGFNHHSNIVNCKIYNVGGGGMLLLSNECAISHNEIFEVGSYGIGLQAGDKNTLTKGNVIVSNNLIHDYQKISKVLGAAIQTYGVGFQITNNEIYNGNHVGIGYSGLYHIIENNIIHDVCLQSDDSGAIYAGRSWTSYGNVIRNNLIYNLGGGKHVPNGIYLDDALSGQLVYSNLLINIPSSALVMGGGRDLKIHDNIIVNAGKNALYYDARAREGVLKDMWFSSHVKPGGDMWIDLNGSPWKDELWQESFPEYQNLTDDFNDLDNPYFFPNPANSKVNNNIVFDKRLSIGDITKDVKRYSDVSKNKIESFNNMHYYFKNIKQGNYLLKNNKNNRYIKLEIIGRY